MMQIRNKGRVAALVLLVIAGTASAIANATASTAQAAPFKKGQKFPAFTLKTTDGKVISPAALKDKAYWITFFSSG
jgi:hypothetical protein